MECPACHQPNLDGARFCAKCGALLPARAEEADPLVGTIVGGRFRITGVLGEGGMGRVYTGEQQMGTSVRKVAVKTLLAQYARDPETYARFMRECGTVSELEHPNTIKVYDFGQTPTGELYIAMELLQGRSLEEALEKSGPISPERTDRIIEQVCGSLQEAHDKGIVHRDLKPANIFLTKRAGEDDYVKVLDFGIAKRGGAASKHEQKLTQQGKILGTPPYMSPEQFKGAELDPRSDIYSLGVVTYEMLTGRLPFDADTPWAWATQHMTAQPFPFETVPLGSSVPPKMKAAVMRALSKDPAQRQASVREYYDELSLGLARASVVMRAAASTASTPQAHANASGATGARAPVASKGGATQIGEPVFAPSGAPVGRTMVDQVPATFPSPGAAPTPPGGGFGAAPAAGGPPFVAGAGAAPTGGGQAFPAPPAEARRGSALLVAIGAVVAVAGIGLVFMVKGRGGGEAGAETIPVPTASAVTTVTSTDTVGDAGTAVDVPDAATPGRPVATAPTTTKPVDNAGNEACESAIRLASGDNTEMAVNHFRKCSGPQRGAALAAIDASARRAVDRRGCAAASTAQAAASVGATSGMNALKSKNCGGSSPTPSPPPTRRPPLFRR